MIGSGSWSDVDWSTIVYWHVDGDMGFHFIDLREAYSGAWGSPTYDQQFIAELAAHAKFIPNSMVMTLGLSPVSHD